MKKDYPTEFSMTFPDGHKELWKYSEKDSKRRQMIFYGFSEDMQPLAPFSQKTEYDKGILIGLIKSLNLPYFKDIVLDDTIVRKRIL